MPSALESIRWIHGAPDCAMNSEPLLQVHGYNSDTFIFRQNKCFNYEGNFLYLLFGESRALLLDTGAGPEPHAQERVLPLRVKVDEIAASWARERGAPRCLR